MSLGAVRRGKVSGVGTSSLSLLAGANRRCATGSPFWLFEGNQEDTDPSRYLCACLAPSIGTVPRAPVTDSSICNRSIPLRCNSAGCISTSLHSDGRKLSRPSGNHRAQFRGRDAPHIGRSAIWPRDFVRPKQSAIRREASPVAEGRGISPRCFARARHQQ